MVTFAGLSFEPPLVLAPMAGLTDSPFRRVVRVAGGCGLVTSEFVASEALVRDVAGEHAKLRFQAAEGPLAIQLFGSRPDVMAEAAGLVEEAGAAACDVNMGCPARKIVRGAAGAALMADLELARRIIRAMRRAVSIPLTVKFRAGVHAAALTDVELGHICEGEGVDAVTLHPRTARQQYSGHADWSRIARLKESLQIPVVGNGDVRTAEDAARMFRDTGCDAVMIGRAALTNPWIFRQSADLFAGQAVRDPSPQERVALVRHHVAILEGELEGDELLHKLKVLTRWFTHSLAGGRRLRQRLSLLHDAGELVAEIRSFLDAAVAGTSGEEPRTDDRAFPER